VEHKLPQHDLERKASLGLMQQKVLFHRERNGASLKPEASTPQFALDTAVVVIDRMTGIGGIDVVGRIEERVFSFNEPTSRFKTNQPSLCRPAGAQSLFMRTQASRPGLNNLVPLAGHFAFLQLRKAYPDLSAGLNNLVPLAGHFAFLQLRKAYPGLPAWAQ
jgi:hypothetical protein